MLWQQILCSSLNRTLVLVFFSCWLEMVVDISTHNFLGGTVVAALELIKERGVDNKQMRVVGFTITSCLLNFLCCDLHK